MSGPPLVLDPDLLEDAFPPAYLERGRHYARDGRVLGADYDAARGLATGRVLGSGGRVYQCVVSLGPGPRTGSAVVGQCSCPVGFNCKHVAALLLVLAGRSAAAGPAARPSPGRGAATAPGPALPFEVQGWLSRLERLAAGAAGDDPYEILYLLRRGLRFGMTRVLVGAVKVSRLLDGGLGKPQPFHVAGQSRAAFVTPEDQRIMALVRAGGGGELAESVLTEETGADVLHAVAQSGRGRWQDADAPALRYAGALPGRLEWRLGEDARMHVVLESERPGLLLLPVAPPWYLDPESGDCGPLETGLSDPQAALLAMAPAIALESVAALEERAGTRLKGLRLPLPPRPERRRIAPGSGAGRPVPWLRLASEDRAAASAYSYGTPKPVWVHSAALTLDYGGIRVDPRDPNPLATRVEDGVLLEHERDREVESAAIRTLEEMGFRRPLDLTPHGAMHFELPHERDWLRFMNELAPRLLAAGWRIEEDPSFHFRLAQTGDWDLDIAESEGGRWLDLGLGVVVDGERMDLLPVLVDMVRRFPAELSPERLAQTGDEVLLDLRLEDGRLILLPAGRLKPILFTLLELYDPEARLIGGKRLRLPRLQAAELATLAEADPALAWAGAESARDWGWRLKSFQGIEPVAPPAGLVAELRPYQRQGLDWLQFLRDFDLGGILGDDMGLGKTVQALAHLLAEREAGRADRPSLAVAPTSLMFNWRREAARFAPDLKVLTLHGTERHRRFQSIGEHDLVLTTYPLIARDLEALAEHDFHLLILDEAQAIKNPRSKAAEAARALKARHRICLTGTPLENHLGELWALFDFLMPDMLGDERRFRRVFRTPIERQGDRARQEGLRRRVAPFLLRRTKEAVAADLPPKTEILREVPLADDQRDLYETLRLALHERVRQEVEEKGLARSGIVILDALLKLRQVCCDPRLVSLESARRVKGSAKLELLMTLLPELKEEGRRVLLFSQFTSMLALIEEDLIRTGLRAGKDFVKLTGQTRNRAEPVDRFQSGEVPLFLISLKAGGSGLNLTAADTVIHYDPWWNPAAERQATDRAHRIGQDKPVFVYKLLTEGTVEQRVADLQARKQALADAMLEGGGAAAGPLAAEDLDLLFAPIDDG